MEDISNDHQGCPDQHKKSFKLCDEKGHSLLSLKESKRKLRKCYDQNFLMDGIPL